MLTIKCHEGEKILGPNIPTSFVIEDFLVKRWLETKSLTAYPFKKIMETLIVGEDVLVLNHSEYQHIFGWAKASELEKLLESKLP